MQIKYSKMQTLVLVFLGGGAGSLCRYAISSWLTHIDGVMPWATLSANVAACLILGLLIRYNVDHTMQSSAWLLLATGFCGGFSTFSTFAGELAWYTRSCEQLFGLGLVQYKYICSAQYSGVSPHQHVRATNEKDRFYFHRADKYVVENVYEA